MKTKSLMMVGIIGVLIAGSAQAQRVRDFSMPVDESINHATSNNGNNTIVQPPLNPVPGAAELRGSDDNDRGGLFGILGKGNFSSSERFMDSYCDPSTQIGIAARSELASCIAEKRQSACEQYASLPRDAKKAVDLAIDCAYAATDGAAEEFGLPTASKLPRGCEDSAELRLEMLKAYYDDNYTSHALLFLPDTVLKGGASCVTGR
jgi:hypothetical protein